MKKTFRTAVGFVMAAIMCLCLIACGNTAKNQDIWETAAYSENTELGIGKTTFYTDVTAEDKTVTFTVHTDKETVGEALAEAGLIEGEKGPYGLYVKTVNGMLADYEKNQAFWAFSKNGESLMTGVDSEKIDAGAHYGLIYTKQ